MQKQNKQNFRMKVLKNKHENNKANHEFYVDFRPVSG